MRILIPDIRKKIGMSQADLAERIGISRPYLAQIESGGRKLSAGMMQTIASELGCKPTDLVDFEAPSQEQVNEIMRACSLADPSQRSMMLAIARSILETDS